MSFGDALAYGLAGGIQNFTQSNNQYNQQAIQQQNTVQDQQFRAQQAAEQQRQFNTQFKAARDTQTFQFLNGQQQQLTNTLGKGGYTKNSAEYQGAQRALAETNKLMSRTLRGEQLSPEDLGGYDTLMGNLGTLLGTGAQNIGDRGVQHDVLVDTGLGLQNTGQGITNTTNQGTQQYTIANAEHQSLLSGVNASVAQGTQQGQIDAGNAQGRLAVTQADTAEKTAGFSVRSAAADALNRESGAYVADQTKDNAVKQAGLATQSAEVGLDLARFQLGDVQAKAPLVYDGMKLSNKSAQQLLDFNAEAQPEKMAALKLQNDQTRTAIDQNKELFPWQKRALTAQVNIQETQASIVEATKSGTIARTEAENYASIAQNLRDPAAFDELVKDGTLTAEQAAPFKQLASYYKETGQAALEQAKATAKTAGSQAILSGLEVKRVSQTVGTTIAALNSSNDLTTNRNTVLKGLAKLEGAASQAQFLNQIASQGDVGKGVVAGLVSEGLVSESTARAMNVKAAQVTKTETAQSTVLQNQASVSTDDAAYSKNILDKRTALFTSNADLQTKTNAAEADLLGMKAAGQKAAYLQGIGQTGAGGAAILDGLLAKGSITAQQAAGYKLTAGNAQTVSDEAAKNAGLTNDAAAFNLDSARKLFPTQLASSQTALASANEQLAAFKEGRPVNLGILKTNLATLKQALSQNAQMFGPKLQQAQAQVAQLESQLRVMQGTEGSQIATAANQASSTGSAARTAAGLVNPTIAAAESQAASTGAQAAVDVATIPAMIASRNLAPQAAQTQLDAAKLDFKLKNATFYNQVKAIDINTQTGAQQLRDLKLRYQQSGKKFPAELAYVTAQQAVGEANAKLAAAKALSFNSDGTSSVADRKALQSSLTRMSITAGGDVRVAQAGYKAVVDQYFAKAKISVDKYNSKNYSTLISNANLTPDQLAEVKAAKVALDVAQSKTADISLALGQSNRKSGLDQNLAQRLGIAPPDAGGGLITAPAPVIKGAAIAPGVSQGMVSGEGGTVYAGGGARAIPSGLPNSELTKQVGQAVGVLKQKIGQQKGNSAYWDNAAGPVRAYNGMRPTQPQQISYVNDIRATYTAKPWVQAMSDASGPRKAEMQFINGEADRIAKTQGVDPDVVKSIMWNESMGWQPGVPSSDGKGGGLAQMTGYFPPQGARYGTLKTAPTRAQVVAATPPGGTPPGGITPAEFAAQATKLASQPAAPAVNAPASPPPATYKLDPKLARPYIMNAKTPADLEHVMGGLVAYGMTPAAATALIRGMRGAK